MLHFDISKLIKIPFTKTMFYNHKINGKARNLCKTMSSNKVTNLQTAVLKYYITSKHVVLLIGKWFIRASTAQTDKKV